MSLPLCSSLQGNHQEAEAQNTRGTDTPRQDSGHLIEPGGGKAAVHIPEAQLMAPVFGLALCNPSYGSNSAAPAKTQPTKNNTCRKERIVADSELTPSSLFEYWGGFRILGRTSTVSCSWMEYINPQIPPPQASICQSPLKKCVITIPVVVDSRYCQGKGRNRIHFGHWKQKPRQYPQALPQSCPKPPLLAWGRDQP